MNALQTALTALVIATVPALTWGQAAPVTVQFSQNDFSTGGTVSGFFRGRDLDGDGQIYAVSRGISDIFGLTFGNELDYAEVTFSGFGELPGSSTVVYDKSVADMESPANLFMAFAYNVNGGPLGDEPDEGMSLSVFSPSTNFLVGSAFAFVFANEASEPVGTCGVAPQCGLVIALEPDADSPIGASVVFEDFTASGLSGTPRAPQTVPLSPQLSILIALVLAALGSLYAGRRRGSLA
jgi:hypothetical protein